MAIPEKQTAWLYNEYGPKENMSLSEEVEVETPAAGEVLVKVHAAGLNPVDYQRRNGEFRELEVGPPHVPGYDAAGVVVQLGSNATKFKVGDRVYGDVVKVTLKPKKIGSLAQYVATDENLLALIPEPLSFVEAASLPVVLLTAYQALEVANVNGQTTILILGGAGGVGTIAIQLAVHFFKAKVVATTASGHKVDFVKNLGANVVIDYKKQSLSDHPTKYDVVLDAVGNGQTLLALKENGVAVGLTDFNPTPPEFYFEAVSKGSDLEKLAPYLESGVLKAILDPTGPYKFEDALQAFEYVENGRALGKVVVSPIE